jgi:uncharacterized protein YhbP (UPF0306 family)
MKTLPRYDFEDLSVFFADFGQSLTWGNNTFPCLFDRKHDPLAFGAGGRAITAIAKIADLQGINQGVTVMINGESFTVAEIQPIQDGQMVKLILEESDQSD